MKTFLVMVLFSAVCFSEVPITNLPAFTGSQVGSTDVLPFVNQATNTTGQLRLSQWYSIPSLQSPSFTGAVSSPSGTFSGIVSAPTGAFTTVNLQSVPTSSYTNCGTITNAKGCFTIIVDGVAQKVPYF